MNFKMLFPVFVIFLFLLSIANAQQTDVPRTSISFQDIDVIATGTCHSFDVAVFAPMLSDCYDMKLDVPGAIGTGDDKKSTFFYADDALCAGSGHVHLELESAETIQATLKLRQGNAVIEKQFTIYQSCRQQSDNVVALAAMLSVLVILAGIAFAWGYQKKK